MLQERAPHALVVAKSGPLGDLGHAADLPALEQEPRRFHPQCLYPAGRSHSGAVDIGPCERPRRHPGLFGQPFDPQVAGDVLDDPGMQCAEASFDIRRLAFSTRENWLWPPGIAGPLLMRKKLAVRQ